jgi:hypothetical protein
MIPEHPSCLVSHAKMQILTGGELPWPNLDDTTVRTLVLRGELPWFIVLDRVLTIDLAEGKRPSLPPPPQVPPTLITLINLCWHTSNVKRPPFGAIAKSLSQILNNNGGRFVGVDDLLANPLMAPRRVITPRSEYAPSPPMRPLDTIAPVGSDLDLRDSLQRAGGSEGKKARKRLGLGLQFTEITAGTYESPVESEEVRKQMKEWESEDEGSTIEENTPSSEYTTANEGSNESARGSMEGHDTDIRQVPDPESTPRAGQMHAKLPVEDGGFESPTRVDIIGNGPSSLFSTTESTRETEEEHEHEYCGWESPPLSDEYVALRRDERRYRLLLNHEFYAARRCYSYLQALRTDKMSSEVTAVDSYQRACGSRWIP